MPSKAPAPDHRRAIGRFPQTASRSAGNGQSKVIAPSIGAVCVRSAAAGGIVEIPPPTVGANVVKLSLAGHTAGVESPVRRALVRQNHQRQPVPARNGRSCTPLTCAHCHPSHPAIELSADTSIRPAGLKGKHKLTIFVLRSRLPQSEARRRRSPTRQRAPSPALGARAQ